MKEIPQHFKDACETEEYDPVDIDMEYYMNVSDMDKCFIVTLNSGTEMVGYSIFTIATDPIRRKVKEALNTCVYVKKGFRGFGTRRMLNDSLNLMKSLGADKVTYMIKNKALARMLQNDGFSSGEVTWSKAL